MLRLKVIAHLDGALEVAGDLVCISGGGEGKGGNMIEEGSNSETTPLRVLAHGERAAGGQAGRPDFSVLAGFEDLILPSVLAGGDGSICGLANVAPELFVGLVRCAQNGELDEAAERHRRVLSLLALGGLGDTPLGAIKLAMNVLGVPISPTVRGPALNLGEGAREEVEAILKGRVWGRTNRGPKAPPWASKALVRDGKLARHRTAWGTGERGEERGRKGASPEGTMGYDGPLEPRVAVDDVSVSGEGTTR
jgi:hypothetical protein